MNQTIMTAIRDTTTLTFLYHGESRVVDPHCYGVDGKGHEAVRAFQHGKGWRFFHLSDMINLRLGQTSFAVQRDYKRNDSAMDRIYSQV